jgi:hypothetical protein
LGWVSHSGVGGEKTYAREEGEKTWAREGVEKTEFGKRNEDMAREGI